MPSTYTVNLGIEKPATGEQSGTWGDTANINFDILDQAINGAVTLTLGSAGTSGSPNTLAISDGATSDGRNKWIEFADSGDLGATAYVQLTPNDAEKIVFIRNSLSGSRSVILFQGTYDAGRDLEVPAGVDMVVKFSGGGATATATDVFTKLRATEITTPTLTAGTADINGGTVDGAVVGGATPAAGTFTNLTANTDLTINATTTVDGVIDDDTMATASATKLATSESIKAYVDTTAAAQNELPEVLANGNTSGANNLIINSGQALTANTINETTAGSGVTIDSVLLKDDGVNATNLEITNIKANDGTAAGSIANSTGAVTITSFISNSVDIGGGAIDGTNIGAASRATGGFTTLLTSDTVNFDGVQGVYMRRNLTPAGAGNGSNLLNWQMVSTGSTYVTGARIQGVSDGAWSATSAPMYLSFSTVPADSVTLSERLRIAGDGGVQYFADTGTEFVVNQGSADSNFRVESDSNTNALFVDAGTSRVGINKSSLVADLDVGGSIRVDNSQSLSVDTNLSAGEMSMGQVSDSGGWGLVGLGWRGGGAGQTASFGYAGQTMYFGLGDGSNSGSLSAILQMSRVGGEVVFNNSSHDIDFRVESDNTANALFVEGSTGRVGIGNNAPTAGGNTATYGLTVANGGGSGRVHIDANGGGALFSGTDSDNHPTAGFKIGHLNGTNRLEMDVGTTRIVDMYPEGVTFNNGGVDQDFRVESDSFNNALFVDASANTVLINGSGTHRIQTTNGTPLQLYQGSNNGDAIIQFGSNDVVGATTDNRAQIIMSASNNNAGNFIFKVKRDAGSLTAAQRISQNGDITFYQDDGSTSGLFFDASTSNVTISSGDVYVDEGDIYIREASHVSPTDLRAAFRVTANGGYPGDNYFSLRTYGSGFADAERIRVYGNNNANNGDVIRITPSDYVVINENSYSTADFRVESDAQAHMFWVDAGSNTVNMGGYVTAGQDGARILINGNKGYQGTGVANDMPNIRDTASHSTGENGGAIVFSGQYAAGSYTSFAEIHGIKSNNTSSDYNGDLLFKRRLNGGSMYIQGMSQYGYLKWANDGVSNHLYHDPSTHSFSTDANFASVSMASTNLGMTRRVLITATRQSPSSAYYQIESWSGNGTTHYSDREFGLRGDGNAYADGSWNGGGADYAEYFEWSDGNTSSEDRRGYSVVLENNMMRKATSSDEASKIIGVISGSPAVVGDHAENRWSNKFVKDDFGSIIWDEHDVWEWEETYTDDNGVQQTRKVSYESWDIPSDVNPPADKTVLTHDENGNPFKHRRLNPAFDPDVTYIPRSERPEWDCVGLMGKLRLRKGQPTGANWIKMRDISVDVEEWLVR